MENLSQWFDLSVQKPWEPGVYEVKHQSWRLGSAFWDGENFKNASVIRGGQYSVKEEREHAYKLRSIDPESWEAHITGWRGLSHPPIDPKHLARRTDPQTSKDAAEKAVKSRLITSHCELVLAMLQEHGKQNANEVAARIGLHAHQVLKRFSDLQKMKKASRTGEVRQGQSVWNAI